MGRIIAEPYVESMTYANLLRTLDVEIKSLLTAPSLNHLSGAMQATNRLPVCEVLASLGPKEMCLDQR